MRAQQQQQQPSGRRRMLAEPVAAAKAAATAQALRWLAVIGEASGEERLEALQSLAKALKAKPRDERREVGWDAEDEAFLRTQSQGATMEAVVKSKEGVEAIVKRLATSIGEERAAACA
eukprot:CAMPEP_0118911732 /NCGR_PEP_ID=MMETSP1166-20130328/13298_1 /TAXON_ID=1104430 /ORGANISM="Chrysoreinhardia sp, Strain CCMP3193" /LENGTH=118 /DNA_ID=CAMNT_0006851235 /DNA_START=1 /DNA_END=354 /DNA_ORIENTATION=+